MKKKLIVIAIILVLLINPIITFSINFSYSDQKENDSNYIPEEVFSSISKDPDDTIVKIYDMPIPIGSLMRGQNISQILEQHKEHCNVVFARAREGNIFSLEYWHYDENNELSRCRVDKFTASIVHHYARNYNILFASSFSTAYKNIKVSEVYCFIEPYEYLIYFVTNKGDYIYYKPYLYFHESYLMPVDKFINILDDTYYKNVEKQTEWIGDIFFNIPLKFYCTYSIFTLALIAAIVAIPIRIIRKKKLKKNKPR